MEIRICQISVRDLIERLCQEVGEIGQAGHGNWIPKPRHVGPPEQSE